MRSESVDGALYYDGCFLSCDAASKNVNNIFLSNGRRICIDKEGDEIHHISLCDADEKFGFSSDAYLRKFTENK